MIEKLKKCRLKKDMAVNRQQTLSTVSFAVSYEL